MLGPNVEATCLEKGIPRVPSYHKPKGETEFKHSAYNHEDYADVKPVSVAGAAEAANHTA